MPIVENDPWRIQYFENADCPDHVVIPTEDGHAYELFPHHRWVYNKLHICETQGLAHGLHGMMPVAFPVFSKPIYNMRGMGTGSMIMDSEDTYTLNQQPGYMWMPLLEGSHVSTDAAVIDGVPKWWRHTTGQPIGDGMFDYWTVQAEPIPELETYLTEWLRKNLRGYTGIVNFETIGNRIIECHLRMSDQWVDLYGAGWVDAIVGLYCDNHWSFQDHDRKTGYSVVLFGEHGVQYDKAAVSGLTEELKQDEQISSVQITFHASKPPEAHAMPPGGFRLAIVNCWNLEIGIEARQRLALRFWPSQNLRRKKNRQS